MLVLSDGGGVCAALVNDFFDFEEGKEERG